MTKLRFSIIVLLLLSLSACTDADTTSNVRIDDLTQRLGRLETESETTSVRLDELAQTVEALEQKLAEAETAAVQEETQPAVETEAAPAIDDGEPDYFRYSFIADLSPYLPDEFSHPLPEDSLQRAGLIDDGGQVQVYFQYAQTVTDQDLSAMGASLGGELRDYAYTLGGSPGWHIQTSEADYIIQKLAVEQWYADFIDFETASTGLFITPHALSESDLSSWFNEDLFAYEDYQLPEAFSRVPDRKYVILGNEKDAPNIRAISRWEGLEADDARLIMDHYAEVLKDNEWFAMEGDPAQFAHVYARLDQNRALSMKTGVWDDGAYSVNLQIEHFEQE